MGIRWGGTAVIKMDCFKHLAACWIISWLACAKFGNPTAGILFAFGVGVVKEIADLIRGIMRARTAVKHGVFKSLWQALLSTWDWKDSVLDIVYDIAGTLAGFGAWAAGL